MKSLEYVNISGNNLLSMSDVELSSFKNFFLEVIFPEQKLYRIFEEISEILEKVGSIKVEYLCRLLGLKGDILTKLLHFHKYEIEKAGLRIFVENGILFLE